MNSTDSKIQNANAHQTFDVTIPLSVDGTILTKVIARLQWENNTVSVRNLGMA